MNYKIALIRGDGIGPEVVGEAVKVMEPVGAKFGHSFEFTDEMMGGCAIDAVGKSYPDGTAEKCRACDAVLLGAVGGPKWGHSSDPDQRPETALLSIRKDLGLYANLRPAALRPAMAGACPLKKETAEKGIDLMMVRELTGGIYFGMRPPTGALRPPTAWPIPRWRSSALAAVPLSWPGCAAKRSPAWTRPTCWSPPACGGR